MRVADEAGGEVDGGVFYVLAVAGALAVLEHPVFHFEVRSLHPDGRRPVCCPARRRIGVIGVFAWVGAASSARAPPQAQATASLSMAIRRACSHREPPRLRRPVRRVWRPRWRTDLRRLLWRWFAGVMTAMAVAAFEVRTGFFLQRRGGELPAPWHSSAASQGGGGAGAGNPPPARAS